VKTKLQTKRNAKVKPKRKLGPPSIIEAIEDENLFRPYFGKDYDTFNRWRVCLRAIYGLPIRTAWAQKVFRECTGRDPAKIPKAGFQTALLLCGRRSGKSKISAVIAAYSAAIAGLEANLSEGETGLVSVISNTRHQGRIVRNYIRSLFRPDMLAREVVKERSEDSFQLRNGNRIEILASDYRSVRGYTQLAVVVDEVAHFGRDDVSKTRSDTQIINAIEPALATTNGKLIAITTPYGKSGWTYDTYKKYFANDDSDEVLVWNASTSYMHPTKKMIRWLERKKATLDLSEYLGEYEAQFRDDVAAFISLEQVQALVVPGRQENSPSPGNKYMAFVDVSGGRNDASALAIAHKNEKGKIILDKLDWHPVPHDPATECMKMANTLKDWGITRVVGDSYAAEFTSSIFQARGIKYEATKKSKSELYLELLPIICSGQIELLSQPKERAVKQLAALERRTRSGGTDSVDHPKHAHDDLANAIAGVASVCNKKMLYFGAVLN
jgi:hypothetical protein